MANNESLLRADLQQFYGIDLDHATRGRHTVNHVAALVSQLPQESRLCRLVNADAVWDMDSIVLAVLVNCFNGFVWGMSDKRRRGKRPDLIGPSWMTQGARKSLPARALPIERLVSELKKPRKARAN